MLFALLADEDSSSGDYWTYIMLAVIVIALIAMIVVNSRRSKKRQKEAEDLINAVRPGNKVKTIGGICGIVVEVDDAENTFILETGSESTGKYFIKFDKQAIYQTDAVVTPAAPTEEKPADEAEQTAEAADDVFAEPAEEAKAEEEGAKEQTSEEDK